VTAGQILPLVLLIAVVLGFAWNLGAHYTGAVMGMPHAAGAVSGGAALCLIAVLVVLGATFGSEKVGETIGHHVLAGRQVTIGDAIVVVAAAGLLTNLYNYLKIPTSTIQILVFSLLGMALAAGIAVDWSTIWHLAIVWACAPLAAVGLGFLFTRALDQLVPAPLARAQTARRRQLDSGHRWRRWLPALAWPEPPQAEVQPATVVALRLLPALLLAVGIAASFVLGANDVSNATGALIIVHLLPPLWAGLLGGVAMAAGALMWGRRILKTVAFDVVTMDLAMASAAQGVQALVVLAAVSQGFFTSMNQALVGAMAGTGLARGTSTVHRSQLLGILRGWLLGPISGLALAFAGEWVLRLIAPA
jgi:PiT family inorganic phosphate transporter